MNKKYLRDYKVRICLVSLLFLTTCNWVQFFRSGYMVQPAVRGICSLLALIVTLFSGKKFWSYIIFVWGLSILYWNRFHNYTSFIMILIAIWMKPKNKIFYLLIYSAGVMASLIIYKDTYTHLLIHLIGCAFFYLCFFTAYRIFQYFKKIIRFLHSENRKLRKEIQELKKYKYEKLNLTPDEEMIIKELCAGKEIKEIDLYSQNTVYTRLREARERNGCITNDELKTRYKNN